MFGVETVTGTDDVPSGTPFFVGAIVKPSGAGITAEVYLHTGDFADSTSFELVGRDTGLDVADALNPSSASGFSLFNVPGRQQGLIFDGSVAVIPPDPNGSLIMLELES